MARLFDNASNQYLSIVSAPLTTEPMTFSAFFNSDDIGNSQCLIGLSKSTSNNSWFVMYASGASGGDPVLAQSRDDSGGYDSAPSSSGYSASTNHHGCVVFASDSERHAYLDGANKGSNTDTRGALTGVNSLGIGSDAKQTPQFYMSGSIWEAAIWNVALTDAEVAILALGVSPLLIRPESLVFYCPLVRDDDEDLVGGLSLTANNGPTISEHGRVLKPGMMNQMFYPAVAGPGGVNVAPLFYHFRSMRQ